MGGAPEAYLIQKCDFRLDDSRMLQSGHVEIYHRVGKFIFGAKQDIYRTLRAKGARHRGREALPFASGVDIAEKSAA